MKSTKEFWAKKQFTDSSSMEQWILARNKIGEGCEFAKNLKLKDWLFTPRANLQKRSVVISFVKEIITTRLAALTAHKILSSVG